MLALTWLIPALPFAGFAVLALAGGRLSRRLVAIVGAGAVGLSALVTLLAALMALPVAVGIEPYPARAPTWVEVGALVGLGVFSTAAAAVLYFRLITEAGPSFAAQLNYLIPPWAVAMGVLFLGESPRPHHLYGLSLILAGVLIAATGGKRR